MDFLINNLCPLLFTFVCTAYSYQEPEVKSDFFQRYQCSSSTIPMILEAPLVKEMNVTSVMQCAISCGRNSECDLAVFRQSINWCKHVYGYEVNSSSSLPPYTEEHQCVVLRKKKKPLCQNNGSLLGKFSCQCPPEFRGRECEEINPDFCRISKWREMRNDEYDLFGKSFLQIKYVRGSRQKSSVYHIPLFRFDDRTNFHQFEFHNSLKIGQFFISPLERLFEFYSGETRTLTRIKINLTGPPREFNGSSTFMKFYIRDKIDENRLFYKENIAGTVNQLIDGLSKGYRLLTREFTRVGFNRVDGDVYFEEVRTKVDASTTSYIYPLAFMSAKYTLKHKKMHVLKTEIQNGNSKTSYSEDMSWNWELDRCWNMYDSNIEYDEMAGVLRETVLSGKEIRLVMNSSTSTDVVMVTVTNNDVVVALADYLTPFNGVDPLNSNSKIRLSLLSLSKTLAQCEMQFEGPTVYNVTKHHIDVSLNWVVSSRLWTKVLTVASNGTVVYGSRSEIYTTALSGQNIRVCVERTSVEYACFGTWYVKPIIKSNEVFFQTPAVLETYLNVDGVFSGNLDPDCSRSVWLMSTMGTIEKASYVIGVQGEDVVSESFLTMTWFKQD